MVRLGHAVADRDMDPWHLLYADDGVLVAESSRAPFKILLQLLIFELVGLPIAWEKVRGGLACDFVGFWVDVARFEVGLSVRRATWVADWARRAAASPVIPVADVREALGRLSFAAGPLDWLRPFLGPLFAWVAACPPASTLILPAMLRLILGWIARLVEDRRMAPCRALHPAELGELYRVDAKAGEGGVVCIGGWALGPSRNPRLAAWYSFEVTPKDCPWAFTKDPPSE